MKTQGIFFQGKGEIGLREVDLRDPEYDQIQARLLVSGICSGEVWYHANHTFTEPSLTGHEGIGVVTKVGRDVHQFKEGDLISTPIYRWLVDSNLPAEKCIKLSGTPDDMDSYIIEPVYCAVNCLHYAAPYPGDRVIIFGAGYMGLLIIQLLARSSLAELVVVDIKEENLQLAREFGATTTINLSDPLSGYILNEMTKDRFDISIECAGVSQSLDWCSKLTAPGGKLVIFAIHHAQRLIDMRHWQSAGLTVINVTPTTGIDTNMLKPFIRAERLMHLGHVRQDNMVRHKYNYKDIKKAMDESAARPEGFIKSMIRFDD